MNICRTCGIALTIDNKLNLYQCKLTGKTLSGNCECQTGQYMPIAKTIKFTIPGPPQGKARARTGKGFAYTPEKTVLYENLIKTIFMQEGCKPCQSEGQPLEMYIKAYYQIPKSTSKNVRQFMIDGHSRPTKKPDADNVLKVVADALNGIAYHDDTQIVKATVEKWYSDEPRVEVTIKEV